MKYALNLSEKDDFIISLFSYIWSNQATIIQHYLPLKDLLQVRNKREGSIADEIDPVEKLDFFYVKLSHKVSKTDP